MSIQEFFDKWDNKGIDFDGYYGFQCMDLAHQFAVEVWNQDIPAAPGAKDVWTKDTPGYNKIANTPDGVPQKGDIIIWGTGVGPYGHIAVFDNGDSNSFASFDQNWPINSLCHYQKHNYNGVLGWLHPKSDIVTPPQENMIITDQTKIPQIDNMEVQAIKSTINDLKNAITGRDNQINDLTSSAKQQGELIASLQQQLTECQNKPVGTPKTYTSLLGKAFAQVANLFG